jgi:hypothetical protein
MSAVNVPVVLALTTTSSCGNGTREVHFDTSDQEPPALAVCVWVAGVVGVIPDSPPQSPMLVPVNGAAAPAPVISMKSTLERVGGFAQVIVRAGPPTVSPWTRTRFVALLPLTVRVPLHVRPVPRTPMV